MFNPFSSLKNFISNTKFSSPVLPTIPTIPTLPTLPTLREINFLKNIPPVFGKYSFLDKKLQLITNSARTPTPVKSDVIPLRIYQAFDWNSNQKVVFGGSYASKLFYGEDTSDVQFVNIYLTGATKSEFITKCNKFEKKTGAVPIESIWYENRGKDIDLIISIFEGITHSHILGMKTFKLNGFDKLIRLTFLDESVDPDPTIILIDIHRATPMVTYTFDKKNNQKKIFTVVK